MPPVSEIICLASSIKFIYATRCRSGRNCIYWVAGTNPSLTFAVLTYMSTPDAIKRRIREIEGQLLFHLPPLFMGDPAVRELLVSQEVRDDVNPPWPKYRAGLRHAEFRQTLDNFTMGEMISVAENPFDKSIYADMARTAPKLLEIWDFRVQMPDQGIRCFGAFGDRNLFIALTWEYRETITDFDAEVRRCAKEWERLFGSIGRYRGKDLDDYLTGYMAV